MQPNKVCKRLALLTCVTNDGRVGPGHTAVVIDSCVYTFEGFNFNANESSWRRIPTKKYLAANTHRPVVIQEMKASFSASAVYQFIYADDAADADYGSSGLCSQRAAMALSAGSSWDVDPIGMNTPYNLYNWLESMGAVQDRYHIGNPGRMARMFLNMRCAAAARSKRTPPPVLTW